MNNILKHFENLFNVPVKYFGSCLSGLVHAKSDIDICAIAETKIQKLNLLNNMQKMLKMDYLYCKGSTTGIPFFEIQYQKKKVDITVFTQEEYNKICRNTENLLKTINVNQYLQDINSCVDKSARKKVKEKYGIIECYFVT